MNSAKESGTTPAPKAAPALQNSTLSVLFALSFCHLLNDSMQALLPAIYPLLKESFSLSFTQIGLITLTFQMVGSVFQPVIGFYTDRHPKPYSLVFGMGLTLAGLVALSLAPSYYAVLMAAALVGLGSAIFHPESSRMARLASGGSHGFAQSLFQVGGNAGSSLGPLLAASIITRYGRNTSFGSRCSRSRACSFLHGSAHGTVNIWMSAVPAIPLRFIIIRSRLHESRFCWAFCSA